MWDRIIEGLWDLGLRIRNGCGSGSGGLTTVNKEISTKRAKLVL